MENKIKSRKRPVQVTKQKLEAPYSDEELEKIRKEAEANFNDKIKPMLDDEHDEAETEFQDIIDTEAKFLEFFSEDRYEFDIKYKGHIFPIKIKPLQKGDDFSVLSYNQDEIYADLDEKQIKVLKKIGTKKMMTRKEKQILKEIENNMDLRGPSNAIAENMLTALTQQVISPKLSREQWDTNVDFAFKAFLYSQIQNRLGLDPQLQIDIFQPD